MSTFVVASANWRFASSEKSTALALLTVGGTLSTALSTVYGSIVVISITVGVSNVVAPGVDSCTASLASASSGPLVAPSCVTHISMCMTVPVVTPSEDSGSLNSLNVSASKMLRPFEPVPYVGLNVVPRATQAPPTFS